MDTLRKVVWFNLAVLLVWLWNAWYQDYPAIPQKKATASEQTAIAPKKETKVFNDFLVKPIPSERQITFETDIIKGVIDKQGGDLVYLALLNHAASLDNAGKPLGAFVLLDHSENRYYIAQTDLITSDTSTPQQGKPLYQSDRTHYVLSSDQKALCLELYRQENGVKIIKRFTFKKGNYQIDVNYHVSNQGQNAWKGQPYAQLQQKIPHKNGWFSGQPDRKSVISYDKKPYEKLALDKIPDRKTIELGKMPHQRLPQRTQQGWLSFIEPYFASAWISKLPTASYYSNRDNDVYVLGMLGDKWEIAPGESQACTLSLYAGPKAISTLKESAKHLDLIVDYGMFWFIANKLLWILQKCHIWIGNWGWSIVCLTILIRLCFYPLSAKSVRSTLAMQRLKPQVDALRERYSHDQQRFLQAESDLYRREKVSRFGSFLQILQFPLFIAFNAVLGESIGLRHQPFTVWIKDLTAPDPYYVLPLLFVLIMIIDAQLAARAKTSEEGNGLQFILPIVLGVTFSSFSAGFVLYIVFQTMLSTLEKWWIMGAPLPAFLKFSSKQ